MYLLCKRIIDTEEIHKVFYMTTLHMLWKMKGAANILGNNRFLHIKSWLPRTCEALIVDKMKETILENSSKYQIGGQPGHSHREHVFAIISIILKEEKSRRGIIFTAADIIKYFDKEDIFDVMGELYDINMDPKLCRLWYKFNEETVIKVKTANGMTEEAKAGPCVGQGSSGGALNSQFNLDRGVQSYFSGSSDKYYYGRVRFKGSHLPR